NSAQLATADSIRPTVNIASTCNAYYTGNTINFYATGGTCNNTAFSTVVTHEWGHGLDDRYGGISQTNGLSEAWADILSMYLVDNPVVGEYFTTAGGFVRTGTNTQQYPTGSGVHQQGQSWGGFAWKLRERLATTLGNRAQAIAVSNDIVISSIAANATNQADAMVQVFVADDNDGNLLNGVPHYDELVYAANLHSLPYPVRQFGVITHTPLTSSTVELTPRKVNVTAVPYSGTLNEVRLHYQVGTGAVQVRRMVPNGATDGYQAMLPGVRSGTSVSYHIEASHSSGNVIRLPSGGEFSYAIGNDIRIFYDGFEPGSAGGWISGLVATQNDWQIGDPAGRTGTGWADPQNAAAGTICAGNDLGNTIGTQAWNGAYTNNVNNWARSPVINCSGRNGVRLKFQRWLTVENGQYDQATIWVNGQQVWANPVGANLVDTGWVAMDIPIPMADNNPNVQVEWRLVTDASVTFGGWNLDEVELVAAGQVTPLAAELQLLPEQAPAASPIALTVQTGTAPAPFLLILADGPGPTSIPGIPELSVGGGYITMPEYSGAGGSFTLTFPAPPVAAATGLTWFSQVLTIDPAFNLVVSNQFVNLFTL
ncbi:MAG: hypothetical protein RL148_655, partial [Planctomycetota bacterium]